MSRITHPLATAESWELDEDLRHIGRMTAAWRTSAAPLVGAASNESVEPAATPTAEAAAASAEQAAAQATGDETGLPPWSAAAATCLGMTALTCGLVLACWSMYAGRPGLMPVAMPAAAAGAVGLALGLFGARR